jgi:hypothetical protein
LSKVAKITPELADDSFFILSFQKKFMKKTGFFLGLFLLTAWSCLKAQTVANTSWSGYYADPINDTITIHYFKDSSIVTSKKGDTLVYSKNVLGRDTIKITDVGGMYPCPSEGVYTYTIKDNVLHLKAVSDECEGRTVIQDIVWTRVNDGKKGKKKK